MRMSFKARFFPVLATVIMLALPVAAQAAEPRQIVGFGDSLMAGYGLGPGEAFPEKLQAALNARGHNVVIQNAGVSGDTSAAGLSRLDWSVPEGTEIVILELGANDMLRGLPPEMTRRNIEQMIERLKARDVTIILAGMRAAPNLGDSYVQAFDSLYGDLAAKHGLAFYPFFLDGVVADRTYLLEDGMHPSAAGVDRMVERFLPVIEEVLRGTEAQGTTAPG
jgi:acyl-CoA thioesterase-1